MLLAQVLLHVVGGLEPLAALRAGGRLLHRMLHPICGRLTNKAQAKVKMTNGLGLRKGSDVDPNWIRIQELPGSGRVRIPITDPDSHMQI